jgi:hypothetical protein
MLLDYLSYYFDLPSYWWYFILLVIVIVTKKEQTQPDEADRESTTGRENQLTVTANVKQRKLTISDNMQKVNRKRRQGRRHAACGMRTTNKEKNKERETG